MANKILILDDHEIAINFIMQRKKEQGGFAASPELPATVQDTFFAVKALEILGIKYPINDLSDFINKKIAEFKDNVFLLYLSLKLLKNNPFPIDSEILDARENNENLKKLSAIAQMAKHLRIGHVLSKAKAQAKKICDKPKNMIIEDVYYCFLALGKDEFPKNLLDQALLSQNSDGGFGFYPNTTSFVENSYYAIKLLKNFDLRPNDPERLKSFVMSCKRRDGGFSRAPGGASFLESTYHSLYILNYLFCLKK